MPTRDNILLDAKQPFIIDGSHTELETILHTKGNNPIIIMLPSLPDNMVLDVTKQGNDMVLNFIQGKETTKFVIKDQFLENANVGATNIYISDGIVLGDNNKAHIQLSAGFKLIGDKGKKSSFEKAEKSIEAMFKKLYDDYTEKSKDDMPCASIHPLSLPLPSTKQTLIAA